MPVTLAQAQVNVQNAIDYNVIDNLRRYSWLLDQISFDDSVNPGTGGATLTYGYTRLVTAAPAQFRTYNSEFVPAQATRSRQTVDLKPLGGAFTLDRDLADLGSNASNEITFQMQQLLTSIRIRFQQEVILGDTSVDAAGFDGLSKALTGTATEKTAGYVAGSGNWTAATVAGSVAEANKRLDEIDDFLSLVVPSHTGSGDQGSPGAVPPGVKALLGNTKLIARLRSIVRTAGSYTNERDSMGRRVEQYNGWTLVDIGDRYDGSAPIIPTTSNTTDLYAVTFGLDAFHGVSKSGGALVRSWMPDFTSAGAVKSGEAQLGPVAMVLKNTKAAAVLRAITVQ